jgi:hypothetical protein
LDQKALSSMFASRALSLFNFLLARQALFILSVACCDFESGIPLGPELSHLPCHVSTYGRESLRKPISGPFLVKFQSMSEAAMADREHRLKA